MTENYIFKKFKVFSCFFVFSIFALNGALVDEKDLSTGLEIMNDHYTKTKSDINEHLPILRKLSSECTSVTEIGIRAMVSTWSILKGLSENNKNEKNYTGIDIASPPSESLNLAKRLSELNGINFLFIKDNDMNIDIPKTDLLFIDSLHTYVHLTYELEKFSKNVNKYIALHDTSAPWGDRNDTEYHGNYTEYPAHISRMKKGLWPAVIDFLHNHPEWKLKERRLNNHGFTILERVK